jgi:hypothetical protein
MRIEQVKRLSPPMRFWYVVRERESIRTRKESGEAPPWTDDEILRKYHFCNVRRADDRVSRWLIDNWYTPNLNHENMLLACTLARQLNNPEALEVAGFPHVWEPDRVEEVLLSRKKQGLGNYRAAYMITSSFGPRGRQRQDKESQTVRIVCENVYRAGVRVDTDSLRNTWHRLLGLPGISSFIAGQIVDDLRHGLEGGWLDLNTWAPQGPGSVRGFNRYQAIGGDDLGRKVPDGEFQELLVSLRERAEGLGLEVTAMDMQNCLCEYDKYSLALEALDRYTHVSLRRYKKA